MLANVIGSYLDNLEEREFDAPFMALLRALGFRDIHLLHGTFEFGKDFIAKGMHDGKLCQFAFQTKAGDIGLSDWNGCRGQIDMLRTDSLAHPGFDRALPRQAVFVTTGRLVGPQHWLLKNTASICSASEKADFSYGIRKHWLI